MDIEIGDEKIQKFPISIISQYVDKPSEGEVSPILEEIPEEMVGSGNKLKKPIYSFKQKKITKYKEQPTTSLILPTKKDKTEESPNLVKDSFLFIVNGLSPKQQQKIIDAYKNNKPLKFGNALLTKLYNTIITNKHIKEFDFDIEQELTIVDDDTPTTILLSDMNKLREFLISPKPNIRSFKKYIIEQLKRYARKLYDKFEEED